MVRIHEVRGSIPLWSTKRVLDEHLLLLRRLRGEGFDLILLQKHRFEKSKRCFLRLNALFVFIILQYNVVVRRRKTLKLCKRAEKTHLFG